MKALVVGAGAWGTGFARLLADHDHEVLLACRDAAQARAIEETGRNPRHLTDVRLDDVTAVLLADGPFEGVELAAIAVPSAAFAAVVGGVPPDVPVLNLTKGLDPATGARVSTLVGDHRVAVLSGPNFAAEIARGLPSAAVVAGEDRTLATWIQEQLNSGVFRVYVNGDVTGVELGGATKNVIALAAGIVDGLELGANAKAALMTRGLAEMTRLGVASGARAETFAGLAGMGDLVVTCWGHLSRNRRAGELIARGATVAEAVARIGTVEGVATAPVLEELGRQLGVELPITRAVTSVLRGEDSAGQGLNLMARPPTEE
ncbi:MAG: NAD(P)H-dependent glycerol-3-phosphate dehydrogenase [Gaiellaceae bacterium]